MYYKVLVSFVSYQFIRSDVIYNMLHLLCFILSYYTVLVYHIILYHVIVYNSVEECIITYYFIVYHNNASCHIISLHIIQYHVTSYYYEMLCHMILWYIALYQILDTICMMWNMYMSNLENPRFTERTCTNLGRSHRLPRACTIMIYGKLGGYRAGNCYILYIYI